MKRRRKPKRPIIHREGHYSVLRQLGVSVKQDRPVKLIPQPKTQRHREGYGLYPCKRHHFKYPWPHYRRCTKCELRQYFWFCHDAWRTVKSPGHSYDERMRWKDTQGKYEPHWDAKPMYGGAGAKG